MTEIIETKIRRIGDSFGVLLPMNIIKQNKLKEGQDVEITLLKKNLAIINEGFGILKGKAKHVFERDRSDRLEEY